jgi:hypothetical protein
MCEKAGLEKEIVVETAAEDTCANDGFKPPRIRTGSNREA